MAMHNIGDLYKFKATSTQSFPDQSGLYREILFQKEKRRKRRKSRRRKKKRKSLAS